MIEPRAHVTEDELHAYVDGELALDRQPAIEAWLDAHPDDAAQVAAWRAQAAALRARYGAVADERVPGRLMLKKVAPQRWLRAAVAAAVLLAFVGGGFGGWFARGASETVPTARARVTQDALEAHAIYVVEVRHPVEVVGSERDHLVTWLSKRLGHVIRLPDLSGIGLKLVGGRLLPGPDTPAAFFMYEGASGERFTLYVAPLKAAQTSLRYAARDKLGSFFWVDQGLSYVVAGAPNRGRLQDVAEAIYAQIDGAPLRKHAALD